MNDPEVEALRRLMTQMTIFLIDVINGVILACNERQSIDTEKLREVFEGLASRPDIDGLDRAMTERLLKLFP